MLDRMVKYFVWLDEGNMYILMTHPVYCFEQNIQSLNSQRMWQTGGIYMSYSNCLSFTHTPEALSSCPLDHHSEANAQSWLTSWMVSRGMN